jgi:hypothetical protein
MWRGGRGDSALKLAIRGAGVVTSVAEQFLEKCGSGDTAPKGALNSKNLRHR